MTPARHGGVLVKLLMMLVVIALSAALAWTTLANHRAHGSWSFHPLDTAWWSPKADRPEEAEPFSGVANDAKHLAGQAGEALWGVGGLVEQCERWWQSRAGQPAAGAATPTAAPVPGPAPAPGAPPAPAPAGSAPGVAAVPVAPTPAPTLRVLIEQRLGASEQRFAEGIELAKRARPALGDDAAALAGRLGTLARARGCFAEVEHDLGEAIPAYEAIPAHDATKLANARQLQGFAHQMQELTKLTP